MNAGRQDTRGASMTRFHTGPDDGKVVSLERFRKGPRLSPLRQAEGYWNALRAGAAVPRRSQLDPRGLENVLEFAFVLERVAPQVARFRLAGQHLAGLAGMDVRGMPLSCFFTPGARAPLGAVLEHVFDAPAVAELALRPEARRTGAGPEARMLLLPLDGGWGEVNRALGVLVADAVPGRRPVRFDLGPAELRPVNGRGAGGEAEAPAARHAGLAESAAPYRGPARLRLVPPRD